LNQAKLENHTIMWWLIISVNSFFYFVSDKA
jgi:hypothetical protein